MDKSTWSAEVLGGLGEDFVRRSYFASTLDISQQINSIQPHGIETIVQLLEEREKDVPELPAIAMAVPGADPGDEWGSRRFSFGELSRSSNELAHKMVSQGVVSAVSEEDIVKGPPCVAILSHSSIELLINFLALIRIGYTVVLIAPQCTEHAVSHLLKTTECTHVLHSPSLSELVELSKPQSCKDHTLLDIPVPQTAKRYTTPAGIAGSTIAYVHHTSGTSTGLPKPIPQTHAAATLYLPSLPPASPTAAFTTTPLYHGGTADLMRSLMSSSLLWLYPPSVPLISGNILKVLQTAEREKLPIKLLTAVPYVIEICAQCEEVMQRMVEMDMVGVGGAPLEAEVGTKLVKSGVKLVSRFGSILMSSYRDFATDHNWDYLRVLPGCSTLRFEPQQGNGERVELVVLPGWPQIAKPNRPDGSYATGDLFLPHPTIKNAYKYDGRSDLIIVLSNGKKFDPTHIEEAFKEYSLVNEAMVFGNNRPFPGLLLFMNVHRVLFGGIKEYVQEVNQKAHMKIMEEMVVVLCADESPPKNSKGTVMRGAVDEMYSKEIRKAYEMFECHGFGERMKITDLQGVADTVRAIIGDVTGKQINDDADLFNAGVDSVMTAQIRNRLTKGLDIQKPLPVNVVFEQRTIEGLVRFITCGEGNEDTSDRQEELMLQLVQKYTDSIDIRNTDLSGLTDNKNGHVVILTGVTGALGAHIFNQLYHSRGCIAKIVCLCRANDDSHALSRVEKSLKARKLSGLSGVDSRVMALAAELGRDYLGLDKRIYGQLKGVVTEVIHAAWAVNFVASLKSFEKDHIAGARNLINLALESTNRAKFYFCSSTAAVLGNVVHPKRIRESFTNDPHTAAPLGYSRSKWVTEKICQKLSNRAVVLRIGQLCGDTVHGVWNETEAWPLMFASTNVVGCLPELQEKLSWLPVDLAAQIVLDIALSNHSHEIRGDLVFNVVNTNTSISWSNVLDWIKELDDARFNRVSPSAWIRKLTNAKSGTMNPSQKLLGLWQSKYGEETGYGASKDEEAFEFETKNMVTFSNVLEKDGGWELHREYVQNIWRNWVQTGFIKV